MSWCNQPDGQGGLQHLLQQLWRVNDRRIIFLAGGRPALLVIAICLAGVLAWWWANAAAVAVPGAESTVDLQTSARKAAIDSRDVGAVVKSLNQEREVVVERRSLSLDGIPIAGDASTPFAFRTYGPLDAATKAWVRAEQQKTMEAHARHLAEATERGDLAKEVDLRERLALDRCMATMLESDDYLVMDPEAVQQVWQASPDGWDIIRSRILRVQGKEVMLVYCVEHGAHRDVAEARADQNSVLAFLAEDAAYRVNSQSDAVRGATIRALDKALAKQTLTAEELALLAPLAPLRRFRLDIDRQRLTIVVIR